MFASLANRWWETRWFAAAAILISIIPLLYPTIPPLTDLPGHLGRYRVMLGTDAEVLSHWYRFEWRLAGNLGVDLLVAVLGPLIGLEPAVKLVVMAIPMLTVAGILWISREAHGRVQPWSLFALPLAYNYSFQFGFVNHALATALALNGFALWLRLGRTGRVRLRAALFVPIAVLIWLAHLVGWAILLVLVFGAELARARTSGKRWLMAPLTAALACLPLALPLALLLIWRSRDSGGVTFRFFDMRLKLGWIGMILRERWRAFDIASVAVIAIILFRAARDPRTERSDLVFVPCLLLLAVFIFLPFMLIGSAYADMRVAPFLVMAALLAVGASEAMSMRERVVIAAIGLAFFVVRIGGTTANYWLLSQQWNRHLAALDHIPRGARVISFVGVNCADPWAHPRDHHLPAFAIARRASFANDQWRLGGSTPITVIEPGFGDFANDPSQMVLSGPCAEQPGLSTLADVLARFPRGGFDYLWLIHPHPFDRRLLGSMRLVWRNQTDFLFRIDNHRLSPDRPTH